MIRAERFGGRRALVKHVVESTKARAGIYRSLSTIRWAEVSRLVFVCMGNICRSPYAEARARELGMNAISLGLSASPGASANPVAIDVARARGVDLAGHRSQRFPVGVEAHDLLLYFEPAHLAGSNVTLATPLPQRTLLGLWTTPVYPYLADPYGKSETYFQVCFDLIDSGLENIGKQLRAAGR